MFVNFPTTEMYCHVHVRAMYSDTFIPDDILIKNPHMASRTYT